MTRAGAAPSAGARPRDLLRLVRPKQWLKNVFVFAAPASADVLLHPKPFLQTVLAFVAFCFAASGVYCLNDASDKEADRLHPTKRDRPVASGRVSVRTANTMGGVLLVVSVAIAAHVRAELVAAVVGYIALTAAYTYALKNVAVLDLVALAGGYVIRALAGGAAVHVPISNWFFIVTSFGSIFMASGKRFAEATATGTDKGGHRKVLDEYTRDYLVFLRAVSAGVALVAYCLWAFERADVKALNFPWYQISIVPFTVAFLRYALNLEHGEGGAPEDVVLGDRVLLATGLVWAITFGLGVLAAR
jgi:decaprenyl-phosphate phosphoribosyltransferase